MCHIIFIRYCLHDHQVLCIFLFFSFDFYTSRLENLGGSQSVPSGITNNNIYIESDQVDIKTYQYIFLASWIT